MVSMMVGIQILGQPVGMYLLMLNYCRQGNNVAPIIDHRNIFGGCTEMVAVGQKFAACKATALLCPGFQALQGSACKQATDIVLRVQAHLIWHAQLFHSSECYIYREFPSQSVKFRT